MQETRATRETLAAGRLVRRTPMAYAGRPAASKVSPTTGNRLYNGVAGISLSSPLRAVTAATPRRAASRGAPSGPAGGAGPGGGVPGPALRGPGMDFSLLVGRAGLGLAWLRLALAARAIGDELLSREPGHFTYLLCRRTPARGLLLLRLWDATGDERFLAGAVRYADWIEQRAVRDALGCTWRARDAAAGPSPAGDPRRALPRAGDRRRRRDPLPDAPVRRHARRALGGARARRRRHVGAPGGARPRRSQLGVRRWRQRRADCAASGAADPRRRAVPRHVLRGLGGAPLPDGGRGRRRDDLPVRRRPGQPQPLPRPVGNAALFLALHRATRRRPWLERAHEFAAGALAYRRPRPEATCGGPTSRTPGRRT